MLVLWLCLVLVVLTVLLTLGLFFGAPYVRTRETAIKQGFKLAALKPGQTLVDLGSGDGAVLLAAARQGIYAIGYEINPALVLISRFRTRRYRKYVSVRLANYWRTPLPTADAIYIFLIGKHMKKLDQKLRAEIDRPTALMSFGFKIPNRPLAGKSGNLYLYRYP